MFKIERQLEESYKALRYQYRFTERENENFTMIMKEIKNELKQLRLLQSSLQVKEKNRITLVEYTNKYFYLTSEGYRDLECGKLYTGMEVREIYNKEVINL